MYRIDETWLAAIFAADGSRVEPDRDAARRMASGGRDWEPGTWYQVDGI